MTNLKHNRRPHLVNAQKQNSKNLWKDIIESSESVNWYQVIVTIRHSINSYFRTAYFLPILF